MKRAFLGVLLASVLWFQACAIPAWVNTVEADAEVAIPIAASLVDVIDPALAPVVTLVETGFNALVKALDAYKASPTATNLQAVESAFAAVNTNVAQLESAAQIKSPKTATTVTAVVQLLTQAVTEIAALVPQGSGLGVGGSRIGTANSEARILDSESRISNPEIPSSNAEPRNPNSAPRIAKGWKAKDFKKAFNAIAERDPRLKKL